MDERRDPVPEPDTVTTTVLAVPEGAAAPPPAGGPTAGPGAPGGAAVPGGPGGGAAVPGGPPVPGSTGDIVPEPGALGAEFPVVLRGYERHRVDTAIAELRGQLERATGRYQAAEAALAAARAETLDARNAAEQARREVQQLRDEREGRMAPAALADRIQRILTLAEEEAAELRAAARRDAEATVAQAKAAVDALERRRSDLDRELATLHQKIAALLHREAPG